MNCNTLPQRLVILYLLAVLLTSCASSSITSIVKSPAQRPYSSMMLVFTTGNNFKGFTEGNYNNNVRSNFNDISYLKFRKQLEKSLERNISPGGFPRIIKSTEAFLPDEDYTYEQFKNQLKRSGCEAILVVNLGDYWTSSKYVTTYYENSSVTNEREEPNSSYNVYLYDVNDLDNYKWISEIVVNGIYAGYDTLNNYLSRRVAKRLRKDHFIH
ncbi:hypothetical protein KEM09_09225 [Carboxylicivirga mesophila]|uniref:Uncharacterized protein n=1 Tax=Carboxylicivirga mesophila TaxID=1166478 RepID=A0ABS5K9Q9_9BACT|nr:hypothetical protein [Carboxylicivirga mesophila]MBS2211582.1 hypothetical protein [Carboxylicivirga mesophila]